VGVGRRAIPLIPAEVRGDFFDALAHLEAAACKLGLVRGEWPGGRGTAAIGLTEARVNRALESMRALQSRSEEEADADGN